ncbi:hypothetical protein EDD22DRAFT_401980 [Suillus occidentalis]|nr:hypothetical protein EDD22DRAFT_401980 [Suillus occidentalis]
MCQHSMVYPHLPSYTNSFFEHSKSHFFNGFICRVTFNNWYCFSQYRTYTWETDYGIGRNCWLVDYSQYRPCIVIAPKCFSSHLDIILMSGRDLSHLQFTISSLVSSYQGMKATHFWRTHCKRNYVRGFDGKLTCRRGRVRPWQCTVSPSIKFSLVCQPNVSDRIPAYFSSLYYRSFDFYMVVLIKPINSSIILYQIRLDDIIHPYFGPRSQITSGWYITNRFL